VMPRITALQIENTNACNLRCPECAINLAQRPGQNGSVMTYDTFKNLIDQLKGPLRIIKFYNYGEPFLHKDCMKMLRYIREADPQIAVFISTNGTLINNQTAKELVDLGIHWLTFSVDGATEETYLKYRVGGKLQAVLQAMRSIVEYRKTAQAAKPFVAWQYILFEWNDSDNEIRQAKSMAVELGVDSLLWVLTHTRGASRRFVPGAPALADLVDRQGFEKARTVFACESTAGRSLQGLLAEKCATGQQALRR
jgi:uncharacterized Fe-S cluster-containing radical SAM superfamily enzyme